LDLVEIDMIGLQAAEAVFTGAHQVQARIAPIIGSGSDGKMSLGGEEHPVTLPVTRQGAPDDAFTLTVVVTIGSVEHIDPGVEGAINNAQRFRFVGWIAEVQRADAQRRHAHAGATKQTVLHRFLPLLADEYLSIP
jgi:hypothetical protein